MLNGLDLFSGIGGISWALRPWVRTVAYVEIDQHCQGELHTNMRAGRIDFADCWDDIRTFDPRPWAGEIDIITGGFPCQDISLAGNGAGLEGERSGLFWEIMRLAEEIQPSFIFLENVPAICTRGGPEVVEALAALGYDSRWGALSAFDVGAPHRRERWWCLAYADTRRELQSQGCQQKQRRRLGDGCEDVAYTKRNGQRARLRQDEQTGQRRGRSDDGGSEVFNTSIQRLSQPEQETLFRTGWGEERGTASQCDWWSVEPDVGRVAHGIPHRVDRLRGLGNSVVPQCAREAFRRLMFG